MGGHRTTEEEKIPSEWKTLGSLYSPSLQAPGFVDAASASYEKSSYSVVTLDFYVYRFSDSGSAKAYYDSQVSQTKAQGGYEEVPITVW